MGGGSAYEYEFDELGGPDWRAAPSGSPDATERSGTLGVDDFAPLALPTRAEEKVEEGGPITAAGDVAEQGEEELTRV